MIFRVICYNCEWKLYAGYGSFGCHDHPTQSSESKRDFRIFFFGSAFAFAVRSQSGLVGRVPVLWNTCGPTRHVYVKSHSLFRSLSLSPSRFRLGILNEAHLVCRVAFSPLRAMQSALHSQKSPLGGASAEVQVQVWL